MRAAEERQLSRRRCGGGWNGLCYTRIVNLTQPSNKHLNILVVDDEAASRSALNAVLSLAGHRGYLASDGEEALGMFERGDVRFDLVITDHLMVRVSGVDLVRRLRERGFLGEIVVVTAYAGRIDEEEYRRLEVAGIMEKPFDLVELRTWIEHIHGCRDLSAMGGHEGKLRQVDFVTRHRWN